MHVVDGVSLLVVFLEEGVDLVYVILGPVIPFGSVICIGVGGYEDVLLRGHEVVSTGEEACGRRFGRKESYCGEILTSEVLYKCSILKSISEKMR